MTVVLRTEPDDGDVSVPDLLGRFESDARAILDEVGLLPSNPVDGRASHSVVTRQEPPAGTQVPFGASVTYAASPPHTPETPEETNPAVVSVHGLLYLRYGLEGLEGDCGECHTANTCTACHIEDSYDRLEKATPER
jgi:hypothetical protein